MILKNIDLKNYSTLKIGGKAKYFIEPSNENEIIDAIKFAKEKNLRWYVIGNGTNILFEDKGFDGLIIKLGHKFSKIEVNKTTINVQAGAWMPYVARKAQQYGLKGLEHTIGIPGNIGGIITMNAGSQRKNISSILKKIVVLTETGKKLNLSSEECNFNYRQSIFQREKWIILSAEIICKKGNKKQIRKEMKEILKERRLKFPRKQPNCGSVFKSNPAMYEQYGPPGKIIEDLGFKGYCIGDVCISQKHANFFINSKNAKSSDFLKLLKLVINKVKIKTGFELIPEVLNVK